MNSTLRHTLIGATTIAMVVAGWIAIKNYFDHQGDGYKTEQLETALGSVNEADPIVDVSGRISDGDYCYAGCWGTAGGPFFPGVPQTEGQRIRDSNNYWTLDGTTDAIESPHHHRLIKRAWRYAERYNTYLQSKIPTTN